MNGPFKAFLIDQDKCGKIVSGMTSLRREDLDDGEVSIKAHSSSINYKHALAATGAGKHIRRFPCGRAIDLPAAL